MRQLLKVALYGIIAVLLAATAVVYQQYRKTAAELSTTQSAEETARANYTEAFNAISEIQDSLNAIAVGSGNLRLKEQSETPTQRLTEPSRREALESIAMLNQSIEHTKEKTSQLEVALKKSNTKIAGMERVITNLKQTVAERESQIAELNGRVDALQTQVTGLEGTVQEKDQALEDRRKELAEVSYVIGTKKTLSSSGIIEAKGGLLGLGKTVEVTGKYDDNLFTTIDTDAQTVIEAPVDKIEKVKVLSGQSPSSYQLVVEDGHVALHITDPKEFRKVKHVVIMTA